MRVIISPAGKWAGVGSPAGGMDVTEAMNASDILDAWMHQSEYQKPFCRWTALAMLWSVSESVCPVLSGLDRQRPDPPDELLQKLIGVHEYREVSRARESHKFLPRRFDPF